MESGAPLPYVRDQMGHSSIQVTADAYVHLIPRRNVHFIDRLSVLFKSEEAATPVQPKSKTDEVEAVNAWCERGESNPHPLRDQILSLARLPVPPLSHVDVSHYCRVS